MSSEQVRTAPSALADGEEPGTSRAALHGHRAGCEACAAFADRIAVLSTEAPHLLAAAGLVGVWLLTRRPFASPVPA